MNDINVRPYRKSDRGFVRDIAWDTAYFGKPAGAFFDGKEILCSFLTEYFTDYEPESCFVAEVDGRVIGYLIGAKNTNNLSRTFKAKIFPYLLIQSILKGIFLKKKNVKFLYCCFRSFFGHEFDMPEISKDYPATLHINLEEKFRNSGIGSRLIAAYLNYLDIKRIPGVYLATLSDSAAVFFKKQGFDLLYSGRRSYFWYLLHKDIPVYIFAKKLELF